MLWVFPFFFSSVPIAVLFCSALYFNMDGCIYCHICDRSICSSSPISIWRLTFVCFVFVNIGHVLSRWKMTWLHWFNRTVPGDGIFHCFISPGLWVLPKNISIWECVFKNTNTGINSFLKDFWICQRNLRTVIPNILSSCQLCYTTLLYSMIVLCLKG